MTELEKKLLLSKEEYDYLLKIFGEAKSIKKQTNYYFDTDDFSMSKQNVTCRIRLKDGKYKGTVKRHSDHTDCSNETEIRVQNGLSDNEFVHMGLKLQGELITGRCILFKDALFEIVLDKNKYLGTTDYELEIEYALGYDDAAQSILEIFIKVLTKSKISNTHYKSLQKVPSKSNRFFSVKNFSKNL